MIRYSSAKTSSGSSYLSGGSGSGSGGSSGSAPFMLTITSVIITDNIADVTLTNVDTRSITITGITYTLTGGTLPVTLLPGQSVTLRIEDAGDIRGTIITISTNRGAFTHELPVS